jgi:hypothetical protein
MKAKLITQDKEYFLEVESWYPKYLCPTLIADTIVKPKGEMYNLSKQNCDEIFGVINVENLAKEYLDNKCNNQDIAHPELYEEYNSFINGFNKATDLNKDKVFTLEELYLVFALGKSNDETKLNNLVNSKQPTSIDVEIVTMLDYFDDSGKIYLSTDKEAFFCTDTGIPATDSNDCLILTKL